jgi:gliding motility-associated-like protein
MVDKCQSTLYVPNAFTPNGDGINDEFKPAAVQLQAYQMNIYNRWGQLVFTTTAIEKGWSGENSETGVYAYVINYTDNFDRQQSQTGTVSLIK